MDENELAMIEEYVEKKGTAIEKSLLAEVRRQKEWNLKLSQSNIAMGQENSRLKEALEIYAKFDNWKPARTENGLGIHAVFIGYNRGDLNGGDIARAALAGDEHE